MEIEIIYLDELEQNTLTQLEKEGLLAEWKRFVEKHRVEYIYDPLFFRVANRQRAAICMGRRDLLVW